MWLLLCAAGAAYGKPRAVSPAGGGAGAGTGVADLVADKPGRADVLQPGPVPDYAPVAAIVTHVQLQDVIPDLSRALYRTLGKRHVIERYDPGARFRAADPAEVDLLLLWVRDYQPFFVRRADGRLKMVRYLHTEPARAQYVPDPALWGGGPMDVERLPLVHESGNLVATERVVFTSELFTKENARVAVEPHLAAAGFRPMKPEEAIARLAAAIERRPEDIVVLPPMPGERTEHVDLYLMALGPRTVMIPEVRPEAVKATRDDMERALAQRVRTFLDQQAARVSGLGLRVFRLPMLAPIILPSVNGGYELDPVFYTPANGLLVRTGNQAIAFLPDVDARRLDPARRALHPKYRAEWVAAFERQGWTPQLIDATDLARYLGLFRCVTAHVPE